MQTIWVMSRAAFAFFVGWAWQPLLKKNPWLCQVGSKGHWHSKPWETFPAPTLGAAGVSGCSLGFEFPTKFTPNSWLSKWVQRGCRWGQVCTLALFSPSRWPYPLCFSCLCWLCYVLFGNLKLYSSLQLVMCKLGCFFFSLFSIAA